MLYVISVARGFPRFNVSFDSKGLGLKQKGTHLCQGISWNATLQLAQYMAASPLSFVIVPIYRPYHFSVFLLKSLLKGKMVRAPFLKKAFLETK